MEPLQTEQHDAVTVLRMDDGKANALSPAMIGALHTGLDTAEKSESRAVVISGREGRTSAGFDLRVMQESAEAARDLVGQGAELFVRIFEFGAPVIVASTGHALAAGAILLISADVRIGADVDAKVGLNEVSIGMPVPQFAVELARHTLSKRHFTAAVNLATIYTPRAAIDVGFLDMVVPADELDRTVSERARDLAERLDPAGFRQTRRNCRAEIATSIRRGMEQDLTRFSVSDAAS